MSTHEWLQSICRTENTIHANKLGHPWMIRRADGPWTIASNGHVLAAIRGDDGFPAADANTPNFEAVMVPPANDPLGLPLGELRRLAMPWLEAGVASCDECHNTGRIDCDECDGEGTEECECHCGNEHESDCGACAGRGFSGCDACPRGAKDADEIRPVWIGDALFDLRVLASVLAHVSGEAAQFRQAAYNRPAFFEVGDWLLVVMALNKEALTGEKYTNAPRIALPSLAEGVA